MYDIGNGNKCTQCTKYNVVFISTCYRSAYYMNVNKTGWQLTGDVYLKVSASRLLC